MSLIFDPDEVDALWPGIPPLILRGLASYFNERCPVGGFLEACLRNDLVDAVMRADPESLAALRSIVAALIDGPPGSWGTPMMVARWLEAGRPDREQGGRK